MAAAVSYYTLLALAPLVVLSIAGMVVGREAVEGRLVSEISGLLGEQGAQAIQFVIRNASAPDKNRPSLTIGLLMLLVGASRVFLGAYLGRASIGSSYGAAG